VFTLNFTLVATSDSAEIITLSTTSTLVVTFKVLLDTAMLAHQPAVSDDIQHHLLNSTEYA